MHTEENIWLWWSSGKDSAWALHMLREQGRPVSTLVTTVNETFQRVAMHAVRLELLQAQAAALGLALRVVPIPFPCPNGAYESAAAALISEAEHSGATHMAFGDLFLEDVRAYREGLLQGSSIDPVFPLWGEDTRELADTMTRAGITAHLTCVDPKALEPEFAGRVFDQRLLKDLPAGVDPCGERGEFHTFVSNGPGFQRPIDVRVGQRVERDGFHFADLEMIS